MTLDEISIILVYSAMAVYALAFIAYAIDLARRSAVAAEAADDAKAADMAQTAVPAAAATATAARPGVPAAAHSDTES
ncbi:MAG: c-type cytochrome biogenesis protein CcsB, partial [Agromyces sp.]|nr:c-type cytochrome biogenesis protein CcsB [Agromyces sp.]